MRTLRIPLGICNRAYNNIKYLYFETGVNNFIPILITLGYCYSKICIFYNHLRIGFLYKIYKSNEQLEDSHCYC